MSGGYVIHTFTSAGTFTVTSPIPSVDVVIVGGGGGGGHQHAGGAGAGGVLTQNGLSVGQQSYSIYVGNGGAGCSWYPYTGNNGETSTAFGYSAIGGGAGTGMNQYGNSGGSGGSDGYPNGGVLGGAGVQGQGNSGNSSNTGSILYGGGGGGAGGQSWGVAGGSPLTTWAGTFAGGGGGGYAGGAGGGAGAGNGGYHASRGGDATANTGSGGGGGGNYDAFGGNGGSGIVVIRYIANVSPTVDWDLRPPSPIYMGTYFCVRAVGSDSDGNLGGVFVDVRINGGPWVDFAHDPAPAGWCNSMITNNNGITAGVPGTTYQFQCRAWDRAGADSGWTLGSVYTVADQPSAVSITANGLGTSTINFGQSATIAASGTDPDGNLTNVDWMRYDGQYHRPGNADMSRIGWNGYPADGGYYLSQDFTNDVASGNGPVTKSAVFLAPTAGTFNFLGYAGDGYGNWGAWAYLVVNKTTPTGSLGAPTFSTTHTLTTADLNAVFTNPYTGAVAAPTGTITSNYSVGSTLYPGTYTVTASYPGDGNYNAASVSAVFTVNDNAPTMTFSASQTSIYFGQSTTLTSVASDMDGLLNFHGILALMQDGSNWTRSPRTDHSTGSINGLVWGNHPISNDFLSENYTSGAASGPTNTRVIVHRPSFVGTVTYHANSNDGTLWESSWYPAMYAYVTVNKATPSGTFPTPAPFSTTHTLTSTDLNATFINPYSTAVAPPTGAITYNYPAGTVLYPGTYNVVATYAGDGNYISSSASSPFTVTNAAPSAAMSIKGISAGTTTGTIGEVLTITVSGADADSNLRAVNLWVLTPNYGWRNICSDSTVASGFAEDQVTNNATNSVANVATLGPVNRTFTIAPGQGIGTYSFVVRSMDATGQASASQQVNVTVGKATPSVSWNAPSAITYGTALSGTQLNATSNLPGTFAYSPAVGTALAAGLQTLSVTFTPTDTVNYSSVARNVAVTVNQAPLTITANGATRNYSTSNPSFTASYTGLVNGDPASVVTGLSLASSAVLSSGVGTYPITASGAAAANYSISYVPGTLSVSPLPVTFSFSNTNPVFNGSPGNNGSSQGPVIINSSGASYSTTGTTSAINAGSYSFTVSATGNFTGSTPCAWAIAPQPVTFTFAFTNANGQLPTNGGFYYNGNPQAPAISPLPASVGGAYSATSDASTTFASSATLHNPYSFRVTATGNYTGWAECFWSIVCCDATVTLGNLNQTYDGSPKVVTAVTVPAGHNVVFTYTNGSVVSTVAPTNVGSYPVTGTISETPDSHGVSYAGSASGTLVIAPAPVAITLGGLSQTYTGSPLGITPTTVPAGVSVSALYTYNSTTTPIPPTNVGSYPVTVTSSNPNYTGSTSGTLQITKANQVTLSINPPVSPQTYGSSQTLQTTGGSGTGALTFAEVAQNPSTGTLATLSGLPNAILTANVGSGSVDIQVTRAGDQNYNAATSAVVHVVLGKANPIITWPTPGAITYGTALSVTQLNATANVPGTFAYTPSSGRILAAGTQSLSVTFTPTDTADYNPVTQSVSLSVALATPTVTWPAPAGIVYGTALTATQLNATASVPGSFAYAPAIGAVLGAAPQILSVTFTPTDAANYNQVTQSVTLNVTKATPVVTWAAPASVLYGTALSATQLNAAANVPGALSYSPGIGAVLGAGTQNLSATFIPTDTADYNSVTLGVSLSVAKATPVLTWPTPAGIVYGTALGAAQLNATANVPGSFTYAPPLGAVLGAGIQTLSATFTPTDTADYNIVSQSVTLAVAKATPTVTWATPTGIVYGTVLSAAQLNATASIPGALTYSPASGTLLNAGPQTLSVSFVPADSANYNSVTQSVSLAVAKAPATVVLGSLSQTYNGTARLATATTTPASLTVNFTYNGSSTAPTNAGSYAVIGTINDPNYQGTSSGTLVVAKAAATVVLGSLNQTYTGSPLAATATTTPANLTVIYTYNGSSASPVNAGSYAVVGTINDINYQGSGSGTLVVNKAVVPVTLGGLSQTYSGGARLVTATTVPAGLTVNFTYAGSPTAPVNSGSYAVVGTISDNNYQGTASGTLTVNKVALTVIANAATRIYGAADPAFSASYSGFVNGESAVGIVSGTPSFSTDATVTSSVGNSYHLTPSIGTLSAANYSFQIFVPGSFTITPATLKVMAGNAERFYGQADPAFTATYTGFVNGDTFATAVSGVVSLTTTATISSGIGTYPIIPAQGSLSAANYTFAPFVNGILTVKSPNVITFNQPPDMLVGDSPFTPSATASSGLPVSFQILSGPATASGSVVSITGGTGTVMIRALQPGNASMPAATPVDQPFHVYAATSDQSGDGLTNAQKRSMGLSLTSYSSRTSSLGQTIPQGWPNTAGASTKAVGLTAGSLSVDKSGALGYSIPIKISPGTAGMQPQLSLNYSSQAGSGIAGFGWSLSGMSAISRGPQTRAIDGIVHGVDFTSADRFYLDGQRLISISGADGVANTEYRTQIDSFSKVVSYGTAGAGPAYFKAWTKAGLIIEFGNTPDSAAVAQGRTDVMTWAVNKISDTVGNYMTFTYVYDASQGEQRLTRIDYSGSSTTTPYASVRMTYEARSDVFQGFAAGSRIARTQRLKSIGAYMAETAVRTYTLDYINRDVAPGDQSGRSMLTALHEAGSDSTEYPTLTFDYDTSSSGWTDASQWTPPVNLANGDDGHPRGTGFVDLDGDGRPDLIMYRDHDGTSDRGAWFNTPTGWAPAGPAFYPPYALAKDGVDDTGTRMADVNGDGQVDFYDVNGRCYLGSSTTGFSSQPSWNIPNPPGYEGQAYYCVFQHPTFVDLDGDGRPDFIAQATVYQQGGIPTAYNNQNIAWLNTGSGWKLATYYYPPLDMTRGSRFIDVNGDGLPDQVQYWQDQGTILKGVALNTGSGWNLLPAGSAAETKYLPPELLNRNAGGTDASPVGTELVDLNGDGLVDLVRNHLGVANSAWLNTGNGWVSAPQYISPFVLTDNQTQQGIVLIDINSDGFPDLVQAWGPSSRDVRLGTNQGWSTTSAGGESSAGGPTGYGVWRQVAQPNAPSTGTDFIDINGDGAVDQLWSLGGSGAAMGAVLNRAVPADRLKTVTNGFGVAASIAYAPITQRDTFGNFTVYDRSTTIPTTNVEPGAANTIGPLYVVKTVTNDDGAGGTHAIDYRYGALRSHYLRGSLGFGTMTTTDDVTGIVSVTSFHQDYPYIGMPLSSVTTAPKSGGGIVTLSSSSMSYSQKSLNSGKTLLPYASDVVQNSYELDGSFVSGTHTTTTLDNDGNATQVAVASLNSAGSPDGYSKTTDSVFAAANTASWILGRLSSSVVTATAPGGAANTLTRKSSFTYDTFTGLLLTEVVEPDDATYTLTTTYTYDGFGNKLSATVSGSGVTSRATSSTYTSNGRFPASSTNAASQTETYVYDANLGVLTSLTGPNNLTTSWAYDSFGAKIKETRAVGTVNSTVTEIRTRWAGTGAPTGAKYFVETESSGAPPSLSFHDYFGRAFRTIAINGAGQMVYQDTSYDALSRANLATVPYRNDGSLVYKTKTTSYDLLNRPLTVLTPRDDTTDITFDSTSFSYSGLTTEVTDAQGRVARSVKNSQGWVVTAVRDAKATAATVTHNYDAFGNLTSTVAAGVTTTLTYDKRGRKTGMVDPDMGSWTYAYNVFGELTSQTDAKSQTTTMSYDALGRLSTRVETEGTTTWAYDTATNGKGKLASVSAPGGYSESYSYDAYGRPVGVSRTIDGTAYSIGQTYDGVGRPEKTVYPTGFQTTNVFSAFGAVKEVRRTDSGLNDLYWQADTYAVDGRVTGETYGNGVTNDRVYDKANGRLSGAGVGLSQTTTIQFLTYSYDQVGNVLTRADTATGRSETFTYDALDRLLTHALSGGATVTLTYDAMGNITNKSDVGAYTYNYTPAGRSAALPHAVSTAGVNNYTYDADGNMLDGAGRILTWTSFNQVKRIQNTANTVFSEFSFGASHERVKQVANNGTTLYVGGIWEKFTNGGGTVEKNYIMSPTGRVAVVSFGSGTPIQGSANYFHTDGLGSITAVTDVNGALVQRFAYDAWGKRTDPATGTTITSSTNGNFTRGYTGHEHLDDLGLIHMNGRVYDPVLGRFLSADPNVDGVYDSQGYNRYSYVQNNPMNRTDPSGYFSLRDAIVIVAIVAIAFVTAGAALVAMGAAANFGAACGMLVGLAGAPALTLGQAIVAGAAGGFASGFAGSLLNGGSIGDAFKAGVIGGAIGAVTGGLMNEIGGSHLDYFDRALAHGVVSGGAEEAGGGKFCHGFYAGFATAMASPQVNDITDKYERVVAAAVVGGTASALGGGKFANGAVSGAFQQMLNESQHPYKLGLVAFLHNNDDPLGHSFLVGEQPDGTIDAKGYYPEKSDVSATRGSGGVHDNREEFKLMQEGKAQAMVHWVSVDEATYHAAFAEMESYDGRGYNGWTIEFGGNVCSTVATRIFSKYTGISYYDSQKTPRALYTFMANDFLGKGTYGVLHSGANLQYFPQKSGATANSAWWKLLGNGLFQDN